MSNITFSYSFTYQQPEARQPLTDLFAFEDCLEFPLPGHQVLAQSKRTGKQGVFTSEALFALHKCRRFATMEAHEEAIANAIPALSAHREEIRGVLMGARQTGLLVSARNFLASIKPDGEPDETHPACYCILTCDRPSALPRLMESMGETHNFAPEHNDYFVIDDSRLAENRQRNRQTVTQYRDEKGLPFNYFGQEEQASYIRSLIDSLPETDIPGIRFLLERYANPDIPSYGKNRNWALLLGRGKKIVLIDDDILFERRVHEAAGNRIILGRHEREADFFPNGHDWKNVSPHPVPDPSKGEALSLLGKNLPQALSILGAQETEPEMLQECHAGLLPRISPNSRILLTSCGYIGDPGTSNSDWLFELDEPSRSRLFSKGRNREHHFTERDGWLGSPEFQLTPSFTLLSGMITLDGDVFLPPYFPLFRNEDLLFGSMLMQLHPAGMLADLPWAVPHLPINKRTWNPDLDRPAQLGFLRFTHRLLEQQVRKLPEDAVMRHRELGEIFSALSQVSTNELETLFHQQLIEERCGRIYRLAKILEETEKEAPDQWLQDLTRIIHANENGLSEKKQDSIADLAGPSNEAMAAARKLWGQFAEAMEVWPSVLEYARQINCSDSEPASSPS